MTKRFGALVGAVKQLSPMRPVDAAYENCKEQVLVRDQIELAAAPAADTVQLAVLGWETVIDPYQSDFSFDALGANTTVSIGDVTYPTALVNALDTHTAAGTSKVVKAPDIDAYFQPLWQMLGYATLAAAKLIGNQCELLLTINTAAATGGIVWQIKGARRI